MYPMRVRGLIEGFAVKNLITNRLLEQTKPNEKRFDVFDGALRGFHVRVHPNGVMVFRLKYLFGGKQRVYSIGEFGAPWTLEEARRRAEVLRGVVRSGRDPVAERSAEQSAKIEEQRQAITVAQLIERWLSDGPAAAPNKRAISWEHDASRLRRHIVPLLGKLPARSLRRADIEKAQADIRDGETAAMVPTGKPRGLARVSGGPAVARGAIVSLSSCYSWAVEQELVAENPVKRVKKLSAAKRERFLSDNEVADLLEVLKVREARRELSDVHADAIRLLLLTGARRGEISNLEWAEIDFDNGVVKLPPARSKTGEKTIPLNAPAIAILKRRALRNERLAKRDRSRFVFPAPTNHKMAATGLPKAWGRVRIAASLPGVRIHDLRHSFASFAVAKGASLALIAKVLGHAQASTTERYAHFSQNPAKELSELVGHHIINAKGGDRKTRRVEGIERRARRKA